MTYFEETQPMQTKMALDHYFILSIVHCYGLYKQVLMGIPIGDHPMSDKGVVWFFGAYRSWIAFPILEP